MTDNENLKLNNIGKVKKERFMFVDSDGLPMMPVENEPDVEKSESNDQILENEEESKSEPKMENKKTIRTSSAILNLLNSVLGIGILSVPNSFINTGVINSFVLLALMALLCYFSTKIVLRLQHETKAVGFDELALDVLGKAGSVCLSVLTLLFLVCGLLSFVIVAGDMIISWFMLAGIDLSSFWLRAATVGAYGIIFPVCMTIPRDVRFLSYFSMATVICLVFFVISLAIKAYIMISKDDISYTAKIWKLDITLFQTMSIFGLTFSLPVVVLPVMRSYKTNQKKRSIVIITTLIICFILVGTAGICGYLNFGEECDANILKNFDDADILILVDRIGFFVVVTCAYPVIAQTVFGSWSQLIFGVNSASALPIWKRSIVLAIGNIIPILGAMFLTSAKPALGVAGSLGGCIVNFMYPGLLAFKASKEKWTHWTNILHILLILFGLISGIISTIFSVIDAIKIFSASE